MQQPNSMDQERVVVVGIDEAGLGPMLGPLCVGAVAMELPKALLYRSPWSFLSKVVSKEPKERSKSLVVCDSKKLHSSSKGIAPLEECVMPFLFLSKADTLPLSLSGLIQEVCPYGTQVLEGYPWYEECELQFPLRANLDRLSIRAGRLQNALKQNEVRILGTKALPVTVGEFNRLAELHASKGDVDLASMVAMIEGIWHRQNQIRVYCDRLGGRAFYSEALEAHLQPDRIVTVTESEEYSEYHVYRTNGGIERHLHISFEVDADDKHFVTALASMAAKYLREAMMEAFNAWFSKHDSGLKPTKGYVQDARRWLHDSLGLRHRLGVPDELLIRSK